MLERHVIKYLAPGWFAVVMGTGGLANILYQWQKGFQGGYILSLVIALIAVGLYFLVLVPWVIRWFWFFDYVQRDLHHPVASNFFVTMPVATIIVGTNVYTIWSTYLGETMTFIISITAWIIGVIGVTFFSFYTTFRIIRVEESPRPETTNFSWIMAPIANMATLLLGNSVLVLSLSHKPMWSMSILVVNIIMLGIGFFLFIFISAVIFVRLIQHALPPADLTPSFGILLSAVGLAVIAIVDITTSAQYLGILTSIELAYLGAAIIWGFGIWVIGITGLISIHYVRRGGIPFGLGWWAYIFPLAAYTIASQKIASIFLSPLTYGFSAFLTFFLVFLWSFVFLKTMASAFNGKLFLGIPINPSENQRA
ncbi:MAG TPA: C4-dicarboxylate ABC transporter [Desulfosporosinus sp.]|nr:C4-dicarboxylate ABC transporter [Desulfosporosinus sp.]